MTKKNYIKPRIKSIKLDSEQAILQVCKIGGAYFGGPYYDPTANMCRIINSPGGMYTCVVSIRGDARGCRESGTADAKAS